MAKRGIVEIMRDKKRQQIKSLTVQVLESLAEEQRNKRDDLLLDLAEVETLLKILLPIAESEGVTCELCKCRFMGRPQLMDHIVQYHGERITTYVRNMNKKKKRIAEDEDDEQADATSEESNCEQDNEPAL
jgi:hypothetical protein